MEAVLPDFIVLCERGEIALCYIMFIDMFWNRSLIQSFNIHSPKVRAH